MNHSIYRISKELSDIQKNPDLSLAVACRDSDVRNVMALIMGPHETPYEFGFFEFSIQFGDVYPQAPPTVRSVTTNRGTCRFNPNIYAEGKVCLSILGTWRGEAGEQWSSAQGLESVLLSIQSLMSSNPYTNEPGFEETKTPQAEADSKKYARKIQHETLRISVIQRLEGYLRIGPTAGGETRAYEQSDDSSGDETVSQVFEPFKDLCKRRFLWYYDSYLATIKKGKCEVGEKQVFEKAAFESGSNGMTGSFVYPKLEERLQKIKAALDQETAKWAVDGMAHKARESTVSVNLQYQFDHISEFAKATNASYSLELENGNPFVWLLSYFGETFDGAVINIRISFSPNFPQEQPRVKVENNIFHQCVSSHGTLCYTPNSMKVEDVKSHVDAIISTLDETSPGYDPRKIVNPEATKLYWGKEPDSRKKYNRQLRRSIEDGSQ